MSTRKDLRTREAEWRWQARSQQWQRPEPKQKRQNALAWLLYLAMLLTALYLFMH